MADHPETQSYDDEQINREKVAPETLYDLERKISKIIEQHTQFKKELVHMKHEYPDSYKNMEERYPIITAHIQYYDNLVEEMGNMEESPPNKTLHFYINESNAVARKINLILEFAKLDNEELQWRIDEYGPLAGIDFKEILKSLSPDAKKEMAKFAKQLWKEMFPPSNIDKFVMWTTGQSELEDYQKILLAPANGIEMAVGGLLV